MNCIKINLSNKKLLNEEPISSHAGPTYTLGEIFSAIQLTLEDSNYQKALAKRGIKDLNLIQIDPWPGGGFVNKNIKKGNRALKAISFLKDSEKDNAYARPIQGLIAHVDLTEKKVVEIEDHGLVKVPEAHARYDKDGQETLRKNPKEIEISQPEGVSFTVDDNFRSKVIPYKTTSPKFICTRRTRSNITNDLVSLRLTFQEVAEP